MNDRSETDASDWLTVHFLPHEAELRRMLRRVCTSPAEVDDTIQESIYRILLVPDLDRVVYPKAFVFRTAKNIVLDHLRREAVVSIETVANLDELDIADTAPSPDRVVFARDELKWVFGLIGNLPDRCKSVFRARRLHGMSQNETAQTLGLTAGVVEHEMMRGMRLMSDMIAKHGIVPKTREQQDGTPARTMKKTNVKD